jgi:hypothetical protein
MLILGGTRKGFVRLADGPATAGGRCIVGVAAAAAEDIVAVAAILVILLGQFRRERNQQFPAHLAVRSAPIPGIFYLYMGG